MFTKILIANRGEIACRVIRTARRMGIATVAVHSDADRNALHVRMADEAVHIGPAAAAESYLVAERIIAAAEATGAQAIHPGYGFLSENPGFVEKVEAAGLVFIGPSAASIRAMGLKDAAKRLMEKAGVPVVPGYHGDAQELVVLATKASEIGYPVLIKAAAGGGGKGMRKVERPEDFKDALSAARRESKAAFGDDRVLVEKYIEKPRHIEVQVFGDSHGHVVHLFERDCSLQRRHQKVIEEAPAPGMTDEMRAAMTEAAVKAAKAIDYRGAGTIEFIVDGSNGLRPDGFWFMEMNTRLQVEHPVTECVTGIDLVEWQLRVAAGEPLPRSQDEIALCGHAFEARVYAEDPARGFLPAIGTLHHLAFPASVEGALMRIDSGVEQGDAISPFYDPMIAKLIVQGSDRAAALSGLAQALEATQVAGSTANTGFLAALARHSGFAAGDVDTGLIERDQTSLVARPEASARMVAEAALAASGLKPAAGSDPWDSLAGFSHFHPLSIAVELTRNDETVPARVTPVDGRSAKVAAGGHPPVTLPLGDGAAVHWPGHVTVFSAGHAIDFSLRDPFADADDSAGADKLTAPMPGLVKMVNVEAGATVTKGQPLLVLEAMKMEHTIAAPHDGVIAEVAAQGAQVTDGTVLVRFEESG
ncbi:MAG: acetyl/propionyl/methylcrotonyl-CoA carboxylase subunit alpha [Zhengella sp.]|uniref:acetyl/propionyl/methylcrotonyl-CoA carboxylase subunit alpha n=1 Tax=Zhengella sp. TaxID=2282762 RepID=UPI003528D733|nr:acetyl/propionyl/methylcrotonyl-CoA carboxylase subunit alpha [Brucellaceae bacterium]